MLHLLLHWQQPGVQRGKLGGWQHLGVVPKICSEGDSSLVQYCTAVRDKDSPLHAAAKVQHSEGAPAFSSRFGFAQWEIETCHRAVVVMLPQNITQILLSACLNTSLHHPQ